MRLALLLALAIMFASTTSADIEKWSYGTAAYVYSSPALQNGRAIFGSHDGVVHAVNLQTGRVERTYSIGGAVDSDPAVYGSTVYIGSTTGAFYAMDATTLTEKWHAQTGGIWRSKAVAAGGRVYVGSTDGKVYAFSEQNGALAWNYTTGAEVDSSPAYAQGIVYVASTDGYLYAIDAAKGTLLKRFYIGGLWLSSPVVDNGRIYIGSTDGSVYALDAESGAYAWTYKTGGSVLAAPVVVGSELVFGSSDGTIYAVQKDTGQGAWKFRTSGSVQAQVSFAPDDAGAFTIYAGSLDGKVYALESRQGAMKWSYDTGDWVGATPLPAGAVLAVPSYGNALLGLSTLSCAFDEPLEGDAVGGNFVPMSGSAWSDAGVSAVEVRVGSGQWMRTLGTDSWQVQAPSSAFVEGGNLVECRVTSPSPVGSEEPPYNNVSVQFSADFAGKPLSAEYPRAEVPFGSDVQIRLTNQHGDAVSGATGTWSGGSAKSGADGIMRVRADQQGSMAVVVKAVGYGDKEVKLQVGLNYTIYVAGFIAVVVVAYYILVYRRR
jgi:outer membrane protein assembly factor BamB